MVASKRFGNRFARELGNRLVIGKEPACILVMGDSTGNETTEWFYKTMEWLANKYPAYTFLHHLWNDTNQSYNTPTVLQTGSAGTAYITFGGVTSGLSIPDAAGLRVTGDLDVRVKVALNDWVPGAGDLVLASKFDGAPNRGWCFSIKGSTGKVYLWWSANGTDLIGGSGTYAESSVSPTVADGAELWLRATLDVDNGASGHDVKFYTSTDGITWTQLGTTGAGVGTTSIYASTDELNFGCRTTHTVGFWAGKFYYGEVRNGINGAIIASPNPINAFPVGITTFKDVQGNTITVRGDATPANGSPGIFLLNASTPGAVITYSTDATRFAKQAAHEPQLSFISYGHNETSATGYQATYEGLCTQLLTKWANIGVVGVTQNPQKTPRTTTQINTHAQINRQIAQAMAKNNYGLVDAYRAFMDTGNPNSYINDADGVHPTVSGSQQLWANEAIKFLQAAVA